MTGELQAENGRGSDSRVIISGAGVIAPGGYSIDELWQSARAGRTGYAPIRQFDASSFECRIAFELPEDWDAVFTERSGLRKRERKLLSRTAEMAIAASLEAVERSQRVRFDPYTPVYGGVSTNSIQDLETQLKQFPEALYTKVSGAPREILIKTFYTLPATAVAEALGFRGEAKVDSSACGSAFTALNSARMAIQSNYADAALAFGADAPVNILTWQAFERAGMLTKRNELRILDRESELGTLGEGAAAFFLERLDAAASIARGTPCVELEGFAAGQENTGYMYLPDRSGEPWAATMRRALGNNLELDAIVAHAPGYYDLEELECRAMRQIFGDAFANIPITAQSAVHGQNLAAGSALKIALAIEMLKRQELLPTAAHLTRPAYAENLDIVSAPRPAKLRRIMVNGRAFGGATLCLVLRLADAPPPNAGAREK